MKIVVGFSTGMRPNVFHSLIEWFDEAPFSHSFIAYNGQVFQATGIGVNIITMEEFLEINKIIEQVEFTLTAKQVNLYKGFVNGCVGKQYSMMQLLFIVLRKYLGMNFLAVNGTDKYICSELCADVLSFVLEMKFPKAHDYITPKELLKYLRS